MSVWKGTWGSQKHPTGGVWKGGLWKKHQLADAIGKLFFQGQIGWAYDLHDDSTLFTDSAGTTPAVLEDPIGLQLDKSKGLKLGPELSEYAQGFSSTTGIGAVGVSLSIAGSTLVAEAQDGSSDRAEIPVSGLSIGSRYLVEVSARRGNFGDQYLRQWTFASAPIVPITNDEIQTYKFRVEATQESGLLRAYASNTGSAGEIIEVDSVSVRELPGNHRSQSVSADRPILSARYNLLVGTETLATQSVTTRAQDYQLRFSGTGSITLSGTATGTFNAGTHTVTATAGTLTLTVSGSVTQADLLPSQEASLQYQRVTTSTDYDGDKAKFPRYLSCNGTNQWMKTATLDFTSSDQIAVFAGVRKLDANDATKFLMEFSSDAGNTAGSFFLQAPAASGTWNYRFLSNGGISKSAIIETGYPSPVSSVISGLADISSDLVKLRIDGALGAETLTDQGTGNYGNHVLYFFSRTGSSFFFQGREYSSIGRLGPITDAEINAIEKYVASRVSGVTV